MSTEAEDLGAKCSGAEKSSDDGLDSTHWSLHVTEGPGWLTSSLE